MRQVIAIALASLLLAAFAPRVQDSEEFSPLSAADKRQLGSQMINAIVDQLLSNRCWTDHSDMAGAKRLRAIFRVRIGRDGHFSAPPQLVDPEREPVNDKPMQTFIGHASRALKVCDAIGWKLPERAFEILDDEYIELEFVPQIG